MSTKKKVSQPPELPPGMNPESDLPPDADLEERFNDFWKKNGTGIFGGIAIGAVVVVGIQLFQYLDVKKEEGIREAFAATESVASKLEFADEYPEHALAGLAHLQVADEQYASESFVDAAESYAAAARDFEDPTIISRALMGQGMSLLQSGNVASGQSVLEAVALDNSALKQTRGEAAFHLAISNWESGDLEGAQKAIDIILELDTPFWAYRANLLSERLNPGLVTEPGS